MNRLAGRRRRSESQAPGTRRHRCTAHDEKALAHGLSPVERNRNPHRRRRHNSESRSEQHRHQTPETDRTRVRQEPELQQAHHAQKRRQDGGLNIDRAMQVTTTEESLLADETHRSGTTGIVARPGSLAGVTGSEDLFNYGSEVQFSPDTTTGRPETAASTIFATINARILRMDNSWPTVRTQILHSPAC